MVSTTPNSPKTDVLERRQQLIKELQHKIHEILKKSDMKQEINKFELSKEEIIRVALNIEILTTDVDEIQHQKSAPLEEHNYTCTCTCIGTDPLTGAKRVYCCPCS